MASIDDLKSNLTHKADKGFVPSLGRVEFVADTIDEILDEASRHFDTSRINLDYKIVKGSRSGFLGIGKRPFKLLVWVSGTGLDKLDSPQLAPSLDSPAPSGESAYQERENIAKYIDGTVRITIRKSGIFLRVSSPRAGGKAMDIKDLQFALASRNIKKYSPKKIKSIVEKATGEDIKIGEWIQNSNFDSKASIEVSPDEMSAYVTVSAPILSGRILEKDEIYNLLDSVGVVSGILDDKIDSIFEEELYTSPILIAQGNEAINGSDARVDYQFLVNDKQVKFEEDASGKVDYKKLGLLENVVAGQVLAVKITTSKAINGRTVLGKLIEAVDGVNIDLIAGENTSLSENRLEIIANIAGRAVLKSGIVSVDPIYEIKGDVSLNTGNIIFLGTVIVKGNVLDGFAVKAAGDIEIKGSVGRAELEADGEIVVGQGILGKESGFIKAGTNVFAKFIENANVYAGNDIIVKEEILHSKVDACGRIICHGKKGIILGGRLRAGYEISAKSLGSNAYTDTILEAGVDPKYKEKLVNLEKELEITKEQLNKINANINTLKRYKDAGSISENKSLMLVRLIEARSEFDLQCTEIIDDIEELKNYLSSLDNKGCISAKINIFPGVDLTIKNANLLIKNDFQRVTFIDENNFIKSIAYKPFEGELDKDKL